MLLPVLIAAVVQALLRVRADAHSLDMHGASCSGCMSDIYDLLSG